MRDSESQNEATSVAILQVEGGNTGAGAPMRDQPRPASTANTITIHRRGRQSSRGSLDGHTYLTGSRFAE